MGWYYPHHCHTKRDLIQELTRDWTSLRSSGQCLASCIRGDTLWSVWEIYYAYTGHFESYIRCDLMGKMPDGGPWGYKDMDEAIHPVRYSCPLKYLDMAPSVRPDWRDKVRVYHKARLLNCIQRRRVKCKFCKQPTKKLTAHRHAGGWVGDECCWDERLRSSE
jgi:hypothetical protein